MSSSEVEAEFDDESEEERDDESEVEDEDEEVDEESDDENEEPPLSGLKRKNRTSISKPVSYADDDEEDDSDDDMPLASLKSLSKTTKKVTPAAKEKPPKKKVVKPSSAATTSTPPTPPTKSDKYHTVSDALYNSGSKKGLMVQRLLARWWYAIDWPTAKDLIDPPPLYDTLEGFPGVFVCIDGDKVGNIHDARDPKEAPCFKNMAKKGVEELKGLLLTALQKQKEELIKHEGKGTPTEKEIDNMIKETNKVNPDSADKEATKLLKANKLSI